ncbi:MAG: hypothetical protein HUU16_18440 [Candidatus Omnitrophica bacterium]|nr:hypothetical protein [Candidatus Omnitrophota bacterium]
MEAHRLLPHFFPTILAAFACVLMATPQEGAALSKVRQADVPKELSEQEAAILEENDVFVTLMTRKSVRTIAKNKAEILQRDPEGDKKFMNENRGENADYWYWAHQKARQALILALGRQPGEAAKAIDTIPFAELLVPEYAWIVTPEFKKYMETAQDDLAYLYDPFLGVEVFLANYQVSRLERHYPNMGRGKDRAERPAIPILDVTLNELVATPRKGEEDKVGLDAILGLPGGGIFESLLPTSKEYKERKPKLQEKIITASDSQFKSIPVSSSAARDYIQRMMSPQHPYDRFLLIEGSMRTSDEGTTFSSDPELRIVVNPKSYAANFVTLHRKIFATAKIKKAQ